MSHVKAPAFCLRSFAFFLEYVKHSQQHLFFHPVGRGFPHLAHLFSAVFLFRHSLVVWSAFWRYSSLSLSFLFFSASFSAHSAQYVLPANVYASVCLQFRHILCLFRLARYSFSVISFRFGVFACVEIQKHSRKLYSDALSAFFLFLFALKNSFWTLRIPRTTNGNRHADFRS